MKWNAKIDFKNENKENHEFGRKCLNKGIAVVNEDKENCMIYMEINEVDTHEQDTNNICWERGDCNTFYRIIIRKYCFCLP